MPTNADGFRIVQNPEILDPLPGTVYPGGIPYQTLVELGTFYQQKGKLPNGLWPPPIAPYTPQCLAWAPSFPYCIKQ